MSGRAGKQSKEGQAARNFLILPRFGCLTRGPILARRVQKYRPGYTERRSQHTWQQHADYLLSGQQCHSNIRQWVRFAYAFGLHRV